MDIEATRKALGLSQVDLAAKLGVNQATISRFENGDLTPNARTLLALEALVMKSKPKGKAA